jgi:MFS family permease
MTIKIPRPNTNVIHPVNRSTCRPSEYAATLVVCRVLLGAGEGPAFSVAVHALYKWFPDQRRTLPTAVLTQGAAVGVIVALPALNWIVVRYSWHWPFFAPGAVGLLWVLVWVLLGREGPVLGGCYLSDVQVGSGDAQMQHRLTCAESISRERG